MASHEPSVSSLADALSRTREQAPPPRVAIAKPSDLVRVLIGTVLVLMLAFVAGILALGLRTSELVAEMHQARLDREERDMRALPSEAVLRDADATRREALARPLAAGVIWQARCALLARESDWNEVDALCVRLGLTSPDDLLPGTRLWRAEALHRLGRQSEAARELHGIDQRRLDEAARMRAADLAGRIWLVERPAEQRGKSAAEGADQFDAR